MNNVKNDNNLTEQSFIPGDIKQCMKNQTDYYIILISTYTPTINENEHHQRENSVKIRRTLGCLVSP